MQKELLKQLDLKEAIFSMQVIRQHFIFNKTYHILVFEKYIVITQHQSPQKLVCSKYLIESGHGTRILWKGEHNMLESLGIYHKNKIKWFDGEHGQLIKLRTTVSKMVYFGNIQLFYDSSEVIGSGASSKVCLVTDKYDDQRYAAKCISKKYLYQKKNNERLVTIHSLTFKSRMQQEIRILHFLDHENILRLREIFQGENSYYLISEYLEGDTLYRFVKNYPGPFLPEKTIKKIMTQILQALAYLQNLGLVHRDIKFENIILVRPGKPGHIKLIDFGLAVVEKNKHPLQVCGTPGYIAPEVLKSQDLEKDQIGYFTHKCDVFSAGVIFYKMVTKRSLFVAKKTSDIIQLNKECKVNISESEKKQMSMETYELLMALLQEDPANRPSAAEALSMDYFKLEEVQSQAVFTQSKTLPDQPMVRVKKSFSVNDEPNAAMVPWLKSNFFQLFEDKPCMSQRKMKYMKSKYNRTYNPSFVQEYNDDAGEDCVVENQFEEGEIIK